MILLFYFFRQIQHKVCLVVLRAVQCTVYNAGTLCRVETHKCPVVLEIFNWTREFG